MAIKRMSNFPLKPEREIKRTSTKYISISCEGSNTEWDYFHKVINSVYGNIKNRVQVYNVLEDILEKDPSERTDEENKLDYFGKHPAYRKHPMQLPPTGEDKNKWGRDWNDESVHSEAPYGEKIGSGAPFEIDPQSIENSIAECVKKILGQRKNLR